MKKLCLTIIALLNIAWFTYAQDLTTYIKNNFEYINFTWDKLISSTEYKTNKWKSVYFMWKISFYDAKDYRTLDYLINDLLDEKTVIFMITKENKNRIISVQDNQYNLDSCYKLSAFWRKLMEWNVWAKKVDSTKTIILGKDNPAFNCFKNWNIIFLPLTDLGNIDSMFISKNEKNILSAIWKIKPSNKYKSKWWNQVKWIYDFIMHNAEYDYETLNNAGWDLNSLNTETYPWWISAFFSWKKIVCDGYTKTMIFILNMINIKAERIVGKIQPIEKSDLNIPWILHSWVKIWNYYLDPTFDDKDEWWYNDDYFAKTKTCFNLNHYATWWILFKTTDQRYEYIKKNSKYIINNCLWIAKSSLFNDAKALDFAKYTLQNFDLPINQKVFCELFWMCNIWWKTKQEFLSIASRYSLTLTDSSGNKKYDLWKEFEWLKIEN